VAEPVVEAVRAIRSSLPASHEWDEREAALLDLAERQAADLDALEADIAEHGVRIQGRGASVVNGAVMEARQARVALARILGQVDIPAEAGGTAPRSLHGRKGAHGRWGKSEAA
jgi:hypothetical protein